MEHQPLMPELPGNTMAILRSVESTPPGDFDWALHCARQQAVILQLQLDSRRPLDLAQLERVVAIDMVVADLDGDSQTSIADGGAVTIVVNESLVPDGQLRAALRELKRLLDLPARLRMDEDAFPAEVYEHLADAFASLVMGGPDAPSATH